MRQGSYCQRGAQCAGRIVVAVVSIVCGFATSVLAADPTSYSWDGGSATSNRWSENENWVDDLAPGELGGSDFTLTFDGTSPILVTANEYEKFELNQLRFGTTAGAYVVQGKGHLFFVPDVALTPKLLNDSGSAIQIKNGLTFNSGLEIGGSGAGSIEITEKITGEGILTKSGPGTLTLSNSTSELNLDQLVVTGGVLNILNGTEVLADATTSASVLSNVTGSAAININGAGSTLAGYFNLTGTDLSTFNITGGGRLESSRLTNSNTTWRRSVLVDGSDSTWEHSAPSALLVISGSATTIEVSNGGAFITERTIVLGGDAKLIVNGGTARTGTLRSSDSSEPDAIQISDAGGTSALTIAGELGSPEEYGHRIIDGSGGAGSVTMLDGDQVFTGVDNTYSGGTRLLGGVLQVADNGSLGTGGVFINGGTLLFSGATLDRPLTFGANGGWLGGTFTLDQTLNLTSKLSIYGGGNVRMTAANQFADLYLEGVLELTSDADSNVAGKLLGVSTGRLRKLGEGVLTLTQGVPDEPIFNAPLVAVHEGAIRITDRRALNGAILDVVRDDPVIFDLGSSPLDVRMAGLVGTQKINLGPHSLVLTSSSSDFTGTIEGEGSVTLKRGGRLLGTNAYIGPTVVEEGTLTIAASRTTGDIVGQQGVNTLIQLQQDFDGTYAGHITGPMLVEKTGAGMLTLTEDLSGIDFDIVEGGLALKAGVNGYFASPSSIPSLFTDAKFRAQSDGAFVTLEHLRNSTIDTNGHRVEVDYLLGGFVFQAVITKDGAGVLSVNEASAHFMNVKAGVLEITGEHGFGVDHLTIFDGGTVTGNGTGPGQIVLESGGTVAPGLDGQPIGTLLTANDLRWDDGGILKFDLAGADSADRLNVGTVLDKGAPGTQGFLFDFTGSNPADGGQYLLMSFASTTFNLTDFDYFGLPAGMSGLFDLQTNGLYFYTTAVAEPSTCLLTLLGLLALPARRFCRRGKKSAR